jgi:hypothetical protein
MDKFCLIHIPKSAGISLWTFLKDNVYTDNTADHFNDYDDNFPKVDINEVVKSDLIAGHIDYSDIVPKLEDNTRVCTIMRDPIERCVSWYKYSSLISNDNINQENKEYSLKDVYKSSHRLNVMYLHNTMTWQLGDHLDPERRTKTPDEALAHAKVSLMCLDDILFFDFFKRQVMQLCHKYGWDVNIHKLPWVNPTHFLEADVTYKVVENFNRINTLDNELYNFAAKLMAEKAMANR